MEDKVKIVIEISKEIYQEAIKSGYSHLYDEEVANAVANGTPYYNCSTCKFASIHCDEYDIDVDALDGCSNWDGE